MFLIDPQDVLAGALVFLRVGAILFTLPILGDSPTPVQVRTLLALALTICIYPTLPAEWFPPMELSIVSIAGMVLGELLIGITIGFFARMLFDGMIMAASIVGYQMGFGTANLLVPDADIPMDGFTAFHRVLMLLIFLALNLHHMFVSAIYDSFRIIHGGKVDPSPLLGNLMIDTSAQIFVVALKLGAPVLIALLFTMAALGLIARTVPQMNVFVFSFPISFFVGLFVYITCIPLFPGWMQENVTVGSQNILMSLKGLAP